MEQEMITEERGIAEVREMAYQFSDMYFAAL